VRALNFSKLSDFECEKNDESVGILQRKEWISDEIHLEFVSSQSKNLPFSSKVDVYVNFW